MTMHKPRRARVQPARCYIHAVPARQKRQRKPKSRLALNRAYLDDGASYRFSSLMAQWALHLGNGCLAEWRYIDARWTKPWPSRHGICRK